MCGIFGIVSSDRRPDQGLAAEALARMVHRGPDGEGSWASPCDGPPFALLGHRRLAIIDLSDAAAQPMTGAKDLVALTYNGEIYNYRELLAELEGRGHRFHSRGDTEVVLRAYEEWGPSCVDRFNGMFAFAVWDGRRRELFAARDRFGEKPFHYHWDEARGRFAFASEIKALLALPGVDEGLDDRALYRYLAFHEQAAAEQTVWRGVKRLPHAHWLRLAWRDGRLHLAVGRYWDIDMDRVEPIGPKEAARRYAELFADSLRLRLRSDVPVGSSLSGGLDSSAVVCQIHALGASAGQATFSARMDAPELDEGRYIRAVLEQTGIEGHEVQVTASEFTAAFPALCYHLEEPFQSTSQFAQHLVMGLAARHGVTVLLDGQGADEVLGGYRPYFLVRYADLARRGDLLSLGREWFGFRARHARRFPLTGRMLLANLVPGAWRRPRAAAAGGTGGARPPALSPLWDLDWAGQFAEERPEEERKSGRDSLTRRLYQDTMRGHLQELLRYGDRNSMAWSREVRQPFLDHRLVEFAFALPPEQKLFRGETKVLLRAATRGLIPASITRRQDKLGYEAPMASWLLGPLAPWTAERLEAARPVLDGRLAPDLAGTFRRGELPGGEAGAWSLFPLLTLAESVAQLGEPAGGGAPRLEGAAPGPRADHPDV